MSAEVITANEDEVVLQVKIKLNGSLMEMENSIQEAVNEIGSLATHQALKKFDTTGAPIQVGSIRMTSKGEALKRYETPYGAVNIPRHVYQTSKGGRIYCPLDERARKTWSSIHTYGFLEDVTGLVCAISRGLRRPRLVLVLIYNLADMVF